MGVSEEIGATLHVKPLTPALAHPAILAAQQDDPRRGHENSAPGDKGRGSGAASRGPLKEIFFIG